MFVKVIQIGNIYFQLVALDKLISVDDMRYRTWIPNQLTGGWYTGQPNREDITLFGVRVMCRIVTYARTGNLADNEEWHMPCDLLINTWTGAFYTFFWVWSILLIGMTMFSLAKVLLVTVPYLRRRQIKQLMRGNGFEKADPDDVRAYVDKGLGWSKYLSQHRVKANANATIISDGVFLLQLIERNGGADWAQNITRGLFDRFKKAGRGG
jgi:hypothetical protein